MANRLGNALREQREKQGRILKQLVIETNIGLSSLSELENGRRQATLEQLVLLTRAYGIGFSEAIELWLLDQTEKTSTRDLLKSQLISQKNASQRGIEEMLVPLSVNRDLCRAATHAIESVESAKVGLLQAMAHISQLRVVGDKRPGTITDLAGLDWSPTKFGPRLSKSVVFVATRPTPFLVELHRLSPRTAGVHRQADLPSAPACYEIWCIVEGNGELGLESDGSWTRERVECGACGYYWSAQHHIWINPSPSQFLTILHAFFPYRKSDIGPGMPGDACAFCIDDPPDFISENVRREVTQAAKRRHSTP